MTTDYLKLPSFVFKLLSSLLEMLEFSTLILSHDIFFTSLSVYLINIFFVISTLNFDMAYNNYNQSTFRKSSFIVDSYP